MGVSKGPLLCPPDLSDPSTREGSVGRGSLVPWCRTGNIEVQDGFYGCHRWGVPALGGLNPSPCRRHPIFSIWGWVFPPKPLQKCLLGRITSTDKTLWEGGGAALKREVEPPGLSGSNPTVLVGHPRALQLQLQPRHRSHVWREGSVCPSVHLSVCPFVRLPVSPSVRQSPPALGVGSDPRLLIILAQPGAAVTRGGFGRGAGPCASALGGSGGPRGAVLAPGGSGAMPQRGGDARGALARPVVPPGTHLGPQLQLVDGGHTLGLLQAAPGLGGRAGPGSPRGLGPQSRPLCLPRGWELRCGCFGELDPHPHRAQGLRPSGELLQHPVIAGGLRVPAAPPEPLGPIAAGTPGFIPCHPSSFRTPSPWVRGRVALPCPLGTVPSGTDLAPLCRTAQRGGGPGRGQAGFDGGFNPAVQFRGVTGGISG